MIGRVDRGDHGMDRTQHIDPVQQEDRTEHIARITDRPLDPGARNPQRPGAWGQPPAAAPMSRGAGAGTGPRSRPGDDDDPLTSKAFSRNALTDTDGRSYRAAAASRHARGPADRGNSAVGEQTQTFGVSGQYPAEPQQAATSRYPATRAEVRPHVPGYQPSRPQLPSAADRGNGSSANGGAYPYQEQSHQAWPPAPDRSPDPYGRPSAAGGAGRHANRADGAYGAADASYNGTSYNSASYSSPSSGGTPRNGAGYNGASYNGAAQHRPAGAANGNGHAANDSPYGGTPSVNGSYNSGSYNSGSYPSGPYSNGASQSSGAYSSPSYNGASYNGASYNGASYNGAGYDPAGNGYGQPGHNGNGHDGNGAQPGARNGSRPASDDRTASGYDTDGYGTRGNGTGSHGANRRDPNGYGSTGGYRPGYDDERRGNSR
jgi:hypothetical protein